MKLMFKIAGGIIIAVIVMTAGCAALIGGTASTSSKASLASIDSAVGSATGDKRSGETTGQYEARKAAKSYLESGHFSQKGLLDQLTSAYGEGFSQANARYAVSAVWHPGLWNEQAVKAAKSYLESGHFSRAGLIDQLTSSYGEGFTRAQALYAVSQVGY